MANHKKMTFAEAALIQKNFKDEFNRLLESGAVSDQTTRQTIYKVALANLSDSYGLQMGEYQNLRKF